MSAPPSVSILLLIKNHRHYMEKSLPILLDQDFEGSIEWIYVDSGATDGTVELMAQHGIEAHKIPPEEFHHGRTRNLAASLAKNEILVLLSADALPTGREWLRKLVKPFDDPKVGGVYGKQIAPDEFGQLRKDAMRYLYHDKREVRDLKAVEEPTLALFRFSNANSAVRRSCWESHPYRENVVVAEDHGMCYDLLTNGYKVVYEPEAAVIHGHQRSLWGEFCYAFDNGISLKRMGILGDPQLGSEWRYGLHRIHRDLQMYLRQGRPILAACSLLISATKFAGVQLGKRGDRLPHWLTRRISPMAVSDFR